MMLRNRLRINGRLRFATGLTIADLTSWRFARTSTITTKRRFVNSILNSLIRLLWATTVWLLLEFWRVSVNCLGLSWTGD